MKRFFSYQDSLKLLQRISLKNYSTEYDFKKHQLQITDNASQDSIYFRLPLTLKPAETDLVNETEQLNYIILLIQAGNCAVGYFEQGTNLNHKVIRAYMVRKKQGKSQIKYLKTKGKSRAGSRVRLGETVEFFENINERLQSYFQQHEIHRIAISCSKTLIPFLYQSKVATPFKKEDVRLFKIPKHIHTPIYDVMMETNNYLLKGELLWQEHQQELAYNLLDKSVGDEEEE